MGVSPLREAEATMTIWSRDLFADQQPNTPVFLPDQDCQKSDPASTGQFEIWSGKPAPLSGLLPRVGRSMRSDGKILLQTSRYTLLNA